MSEIYNNDNDLIITRNVLFGVSRFIDVNLAHEYETVIQPIIMEVQQVEIKPQIGDNLLLSLCNYVGSRQQEFDSADYEVTPWRAKDYWIKDLQDPEAKYQALLFGCKYRDKCNNLKQLAGLFKAVGYYTYAYMINANSTYLSVGGQRYMNDETSQLAEIKERTRVYSVNKGIAESYMQDCLIFMHDYREELNISCNNNYKKRNKRIKIIGD